MPAKSNAQRKWAFAVKGTKWAKEHHFDTPGKLPERVAKKKPKRKPKKSKKRRTTSHKSKMGRDKWRRSK